jgi:signal transduction histidine kinase/ActR/RegA family two-component response regulator
MSAAEKRKLMRNRLATTIVGVAVFVLLIVMAVSTSVYYSGMKDRLFEERQAHLIEFTNKVAQVMDVMVEASWERLDAAEHILGQADEQVESEEELLDLLASLNEFGGEGSSTLVLAVDGQNRYYSSDGYSDYWSDVDLQSVLEDHGGKAVASIPHLSNKTYFLFIKRLDSPVQLEKESRSIDRLMLAVDAASLEEKLSVQVFNGECYSYLVDDDGLSLYQYTYGNSFIKEENILDAISDYEVLAGTTHAEMEDALTRGESVVQEFLYVDDTGTSEKWFVSNARIELSDWSVLLFVPSEVLGAYSENVLSVTTRFFAIVALVFAAIFTLMMFLVLAGRADKKLLQQEKDSNRMLGEAARRAENANQAKSDFLSHMSHDIRTPINAIVGMTDIAIRHLDDRDKVEDCLYKIDGSSKHLFGLINDVLDMSRIESGKVNMNYEPFVLMDCLNNCAAIVEGQLISKNLELIREFDLPDHLTVISDELHLRQIFINILGNSVKFTPEGGKLFFRASRTRQDGKDVFHFELEDTGIGMKTEFLDHIFEAFAQEDNGARTTSKGTGLGMTITKEFVELMHGTIAVESTLDVGTRFTLEFPMEIAGEEAKDSVASDEASDLQGMKVLLAEDNELNMEIAKELLEDQGVLVTTAENGKAAVELFEQSEPGTFDLILMDIVMPVMDGLKAAKAIRELDREDAGTIPILAMTANAYEDDIRKTREAGMNKHISKPIEAKRLYAELARFRKQ